MKKIFTLALSALLAMPIMLADNQLPNNDFEGSWVTCYPYNASGYSKAVGENPDSWCISHVAGISKASGFLSGLKGTGSNAFGEKITGHDSESAVKIYNGTAGLGGSLSRNVPGYFTLGTTWNTAEGFETSTHDGGSFGGVTFTNRPDAISFYYQRTLVDESTEAATMVVYSWKGTWTQTNVPGDITMATSTSSGKMTIINRDRAVLGLMDEAALGDTPTASDDAELIASKTYLIEGAVTDWTYCLQEIDYATTSTPEMINVIFAANNYFDRALSTPDNTLSVDDVKLLYYSQLASLSVDGETVEGFAENVYKYNLDSYLPESEDAIAFTLKGQSGTAQVVTTLDEISNTAVITVINHQGTDAEGLDSHVYTIQFAEKPAQTDALTEKISYEGTLLIQMMGATVNDGDTSSYKVYVDPESEVGKCTFSLPNFSLNMGGDEPVPFGDIVIENASYIYDATAGTISYAGTKTGLELAEGEIVADCDLTGEETSDKKAHFVINVTWKDGLGAGMDVPIYVEFNGARMSSAVQVVAADEMGDAEVEYYNLQGIRIANPQAGQIVIRRQGNTATKIKY